jgi:hypothetical protein
VLAVAVTLSACLAAPPEEQAGISSADRNNAFRGIPFGTPLEEVRKKWDLTPVGDSPADDPLKLFIKNDEVRAIGNLTLQEVTYYFFQGKFYGVEIVTPDTRQTETLRQALEIAYGRPPFAGNSPDAVAWPGDHVSTLLIMSPLSGEGRTFLFSNPIQSGYEAYFLESARKTATQL